MQPSHEWAPTVRIQTQKNTPKRKAEGQSSTLKNNTKKLKKEIAPKQYVAEGEYRRPGSWGPKKPLCITTADIPLTNAEVFRLRGWYWTKAPKDSVVHGMGGVEDVMCESPRGTTFW
ncbi:hypothetical protein EJ02DRAFT_42271 [Clathrospora elynae]|uniref:Uncharacterized protein n=1 Tax=Clathrospora elynae TaxID=706981 RepID=A0A6A5SB02_9PLEO|nr:hypothetical protein EJ02DRAFT_42271 [Clathrospora elynae]